MRLAVWIGIVLAALAGASVVAASGLASQFVGAQRCGKCHQAAYQAWKDSSHAKAHHGLSGKQAEDPRCVQCHGSTAGHKRGVQCESCHGTGKHYAERYVMKDPELARIVGLVEVTEKTCRRCHTETSPSIRSYDHERKWKSISHGLDPAEAPASKMPSS